MPDMDKCACGRWKTETARHCKNCAAAERTKVCDYDAMNEQARRLRSARPWSCGRRLKHPAHLYTKCADMRSQGLSRRAMADLLGLTIKDVHQILHTIDSRKRSEAVQHG